MRYTPKEGRFVVGVWHLEDIPHLVTDVDSEAFGLTVIEQQWVGDTLERFRTEGQAMGFIESRPRMWEWLYTLDHVGPNGRLRIGFQQGHAWHRVNELIPAGSVN